MLVPLTLEQQSILSISTNRNFERFVNVILQAINSRTGQYQVTVQSISAILREVFFTNGIKIKFTGDGLSTGTLAYCPTDMRRIKVSTNPPAYLTQSLTAVGAGQRLDRQHRSVYDLNSFVDKFIPFLNKYESAWEHYRNSQAVATRLAEAEANSLINRDDKRKQRLEHEPKRHEMYEALLDIVDDDSLTSTIAGEVINLTLPNNLKVRLESDYDGFRVAEVFMTDKTTDLATLKSFLTILATSKVN